MKATSENIPQVLALAQVARGGKVNLKKDVTKHLGRDTLYFDIRDEVLLTNQATATAEPVEVRGSRMVLPESVMQTLGLEQGALLALLQRENAVALKAATVEEQPGDYAHVTDIETPHALTRIAHTNPMPDVLLPQLRAYHADTHLRYDVRGYLQGRETLPAWQARKLLDCADPGDDALREHFVEERLAHQSDDGSWNSNVLLTARNLRELADLGLMRDDAPVQRAVEWLMARPQSVHNPGQWFAADDLIAEQAEVVAARQQGKGGRFRQIKTSEKKRLMSGDSLIQAPCGPRIMWPNGLVLEALLKLGYEDHPRVQTALRTMTINDWCECGYQHGLSSWRRKEPLIEEQLDTFERVCIAQYRYGGFSDFKWLTGTDAPPRIAHAVKPDGDMYDLRMPNHIQGCEFITTRSLRQVPASYRAALRGSASLAFRGHPTR